MAAEAHFFEINGGRPPQSIIDVGAGEGGYLDDVVEIERYHRHQRTSALKNSDRERIVVDICSDKFTVARKFDVITCFDVLEHLRVPDTALKKHRAYLIQGNFCCGNRKHIVYQSWIQNWWL